MNYDDAQMLEHLTFIQLSNVLAQAELRFHSNSGNEINLPVDDFPGV
jgi:hypothetical protein